MCGILSAEVVMKNKLISQLCRSCLCWSAGTLRFWIVCVGVDLREGLGQASGARWCQPP